MTTFLMFDDDGKLRFTNYPENAYLFLRKDDCLIVIAIIDAVWDGTKISIENYRDGFIMSNKREIIDRHHNVKKNRLKR